MCHKVKRLSHVVGFPENNLAKESQVQRTIPYNMWAGNKFAETFPWKEMLCLFYVYLCYV